MNKPFNVKVLSNSSDIQKIHEESLRILREIGIKKC